MEVAITFFFGSGADSDYCKELPSGQSFTEALLKDDSNNRKIRKAFLGEQCAALYLLTYNSHKFFLQTIWNHRDELKVKKCFGEETIEMCNRLYDPEITVIDSEEKKKIDAYCHEWYYYVTGNPDKYGGERYFEPQIEEIQSFFWNEDLFFDTLDEKFNSLRFPKDSNRAKRVMNAYTAIFALMLSKVYKFDANDGNMTFRNVFDLLSKSYQCVKDNKLTYYEAVAEYVSAANATNCHFVTTNYTELAGRCIRHDARENGMIYLHGRLTWFEDLENLTVYDVTDSAERLCAEKAAEKKMLMPFILIPSGVKPLVCTRQIEEFHKFIEALRASDELCVIGYRFNSEDNHVNAIIGEWLRANKQHRLIYFNWNDNIDFKKLKWASAFSYLHNAEAKEVTSTSEQIVCISIDGSNATQKLKEYLNIRRKH